MTIDKNSWHYKLVAYLDLLPRRQTNLCAYFWKVILVFCLVPLVLFMITYGFLLHSLAYILGFKVTNFEIREETSVLWHFNLGKIKIYPFWLWTALAFVLMMMWFTKNYSGPKWILDIAGIIILIALVRIFWLSLGLQIDKTRQKLVMKSFWFGKHKVYPFLIWLAAAFFAITVYTLLVWGEVGLIILMASIVSLALFYPLLQRFVNWLDKIEIVYQKSPSPQRPRKSKKGASEFWKLIQAYFKAKKDKVCPLITFKD